MFSQELIWALVVYAVVMAITPGPNNLLLLSSGLIFGLRRTTGHLTGILAGVWLQICLTGLGLGLLFSRFPALQLALKMLGTLYMLWLAWRLWRAAAAQAKSSARPIGFFAALGFQFVNPKAWLMATTVIAVFVPSGAVYAERLAITALIFIVVALPCITLWAASGAWLRGLLQQTLWRQTINRGLALLSAMTALLFWL